MNNAMWILVGLLVSQHVVAGQVTITNPGQEETENSKTLCVYQNSQYTFTFITKAQSCPYAKTFESEDTE